MQRGAESRKKSSLARPSRHFACHTTCNGSSAISPVMIKPKLANAPDAKKDVPRRWLENAYATLMRAQAMYFDNGCVITLINPSQTRPQLSGRYGCDKKYTLHAAPLTLRYHGYDAKYRFQQASHLCGNARCINIEHLKWEFPSENVDRDLCHKWETPFTCAERGHDPPCIMQDMDDGQEIQEELWRQRRRIKNKRKRQDSPDISSRTVSFLPHLSNRHL